MVVLTNDEKHELRNYDGVHTVGEKKIDGEWHIVLHVADGKYADRLPSWVYGYPVRVEIDNIPSPSFTSSNTRMRRPLPTGVSVSTHPEDAVDYVATGTVGFALTDGKTDYITSNNHVIGTNVRLSDNPRIISPGYADTGDAYSVVGNVVDRIPFPRNANLFEGLAPEGERMKVDLAWAETSVELSPALLDLGYYSSDPVEPDDHHSVYAATRSRGVVEADITELGMVGLMKVTDDFFVTYEDCFRIDTAGISGDSGSPVVLQDGEPYTPLGMLFAGGENTAVCHTATNVLDATGLEILGADRTEQDTYQPPENVHPADPDARMPRPVLLLVGVLLLLIALAD